MSYLERAEKLEEEAKRLRELHALQEEGERLIAVGAFIVDTDANKMAKVTGLKKGCIDFSADYLDGSYSRGYDYVVRNWRIATPGETASQTILKPVASIEAIVEELKKVIPEENFRKQPEHATTMLQKLEAEYKLNTVDFLTGLYNDSIGDDDLESWLSEYDNFILFSGDAHALNTQRKDVGEMTEKNTEQKEYRFSIKYRDEETLERLKAMDIISYLPELQEQLRFLFVSSPLTREELQAIDGVLKVEDIRMGTLCEDGEPN